MVCVALQLPALGLISKVYLFCAVNPSDSDRHTSKSLFFLSFLTTLVELLSLYSNDRRVLMKTYVYL